MSRPPRPIDVDKVTIAVLVLLRDRAAKPCPTQNEIIEFTGLQRREVWPFIDLLQERGLVEVETRGGQPALLRRMRQAGGPWTAWTQRKAPKLSHVGPVGQTGCSPETGS